MDINLVFNVIFAWASVVLAFLATIIWLLRILLQKKIIPRRSFLNRAHRSLRLSHIGIGIAFLVTSILHALFSSQALLSINYGTLVVVNAALLSVMYLIKKKVLRSAWLIVHRMLTITLIVLLGIHIYDIGGAPATTLLIRNLSDRTVAYASSDTDASNDQLLNLATEMSDESGATAFKDGVYTGVADGFGPDLTVEVTIKDGLIAGIDIVSHNEVGKNYYGLAMQKIPTEIIDSQSVDVDSVSGATFTSEGIKKAVADALAQASGDSEKTTLSTTRSPIEYDALLAMVEQVAETLSVDGVAPQFNDGVYTGVADGYGPDLTVEVTIQGGLITDIAIVSHNERGVNYYGPAMDTVPDEIIETQGVEVDSVSGSTYTSMGIKNAVADALSQATNDKVELATTEEHESDGGGRHGGGNGNRNRQ